MLGISNRNLHKAKKEKNDEFYTLYHDVEQEVERYVEYDKNTFRGKIVLCNCDDALESAFFRYFALRFNHLGLKQLIGVSHKGSRVSGTRYPIGNPGTAKVFVVNELRDFDGDGDIDILDILKSLEDGKVNYFRELEGDGDFRSPECVDLLKQADIVVTNPPFSLFREFVRLLFEYNKKFLILGNMNAVTYKEIFPLIKDNKMWLGVHAKPIEFIIPDKGIRKKVNSRWFTNLPRGYKIKPMQLQTMEENLRFNKKLREHPFAYKKYDGVMGVPISFLDSYCPDQFEIVGWTRHNDLNMDGGYWKGGKSDATIDGKQIYMRILIRHRKTILQNNFKHA